MLAQVLYVYVRYGKVLERHTVITTIGQTQQDFGNRELYEATLRPNSSTARQLASGVGASARKSVIRPLACRQMHPVAHHNAQQARPSPLKSQSQAVRAFLS
jgi:hypothetical protein